MTLPALSEDYTLSETGLRIHDVDMTLARFTEVCYMLGRFHEAVRFAIGDAILQGEHLFGEESYGAVDEMGLSPEAMKEYVRVAQRVPPSRRRKGLSWSHHRAVAALEPPAQKEWLAKAKSEGLSHHALRDELRNGAEPRETCPTCGKTL